MVNSKVHLTATFLVKKEKVSEAKKLFATIVEPSRNEAGCIVYDLFQAKDNESKFIFIEEWEDRASLDKHLTSPHILKIKPLLNKLLVRDLVIQYLNKI